MQILPRNIRASLPRFFTSLLHAAATGAPVRTHLLRLLRLLRAHYGDMRNARELQQTADDDPSGNLNTTVGTASTHITNISSSSITLTDIQV